jgi:LAS superfamily LD-carboxypeptidase LdcB
VLTVTGYRQGQPLELQLSYVGKTARGLDAYLAPDAAADFARMAAACKEATGCDLVINEGYRSIEKQRRIYELWEAVSFRWKTLPEDKRGPAPKRPHKPGHSVHGYGKAVDIDLYDDHGREREYTQWIVAHHERFGFKRTIPSEHWHFEHTGESPCS